ncbi:hypothetical protein Vadar_024016 [Vaccinium darrowii]|uniref:Uncharacterized protein n=1 Tax=Vaccinium darrowii TaxID=229202 RepID=A0ACB7YG39_9ERIC|nr:hypothetical protein Vadar_024016 [Vaccinium darrowii]
MTSIYAFRVVLLEIVCGLRPRPSIDEFHFLVNWVWSLYQERRILDAIEDRLGDQYVVKEAEKVLILALALSYPIAGERPKTQDIRTRQTICYGVRHEKLYYLDLVSKSSDKLQVQTQTHTYDSYNYEILNYDYTGASEDVDTSVDTGVSSLDSSRVEDSPVIDTASMSESPSLQPDMHNQSLVEDVPEFVPESVPNSPRRNPPRSNKGIPKPMYEPELTSKAKYPMSQYVSTHRLSESNKSFVNQLSIATQEPDVYAFGVVLLEIVCGLRPGPSIDEFHFLVDWVWSLYQEGRILDAAKQRLRGEYVVEEEQKVLILALACSHPIAGERPKTQAIVQILSGLVPVPYVPPFKPDFVWRSMSLHGRG